MTRTTSAPDPWAGRTAIAESRRGSDGEETRSTGRFDVEAIAATLPETAATLLLDTSLTVRGAASARLLRVYRPPPPHDHATCDAYLYVVAGRGTLWMRDAETEAEFGPGELLFFEKGTVHALTQILAEPLVFLPVDTPRREPTDIVFLSPEDGSPVTFMARNTAP